MVHQHYLVFHRNFPQIISIRGQSIRNWQLPTTSNKKKIIVPRRTANVLVKSNRSLSLPACEIYYTLIAYWVTGVSNRTIYINTILYTRGIHLVLTAEWIRAEFSGPSSISDQEVAAGAPLDGNSIIEFFSAKIVRHTGGRLSFERFVKRVFLFVFINLRRMKTRPHPPSESRLTIMTEATAFYVDRN